MDLPELLDPSNSAFVLFASLEVEHGSQAGEHYFIRKIFLGPGVLAHFFRYVQYNMQIEFNSQNPQEVGIVVHA